LTATPASSLGIPSKAAVGRGGVDPGQCHVSGRLSGQLALLREVMHQLRDIAPDLVVDHRQARIATCLPAEAGKPSADDPNFARFLVDAGIDSISVTPDSFFAVKANVAAAEREGAIAP
jgi:hypothetical protein